MRTKFILHESAEVPLALLQTKDYAFVTASLDE